jgi:threonine dehydrogenase-like Zn-dependent dehydrogenase
VAVYPHRGCGECLWCREGEPRYCLNPPPGQGGFAEYIVVPAVNLVPLPDDVEDRSGALAEPLGVAIRAVEMAEAKPGDVAYVSGLGSLGLLAVAALAASGCRVIGADPREDRRRFALDLGCEEAFDNTREDTVIRTLALDPKGPRVVLECAGVPDSLQQVFDTAGYGGVVGILGVPMAPTTLLRMTLRELTAFSVRGPTIDSMRRAVDLLRERPAIATVITDVVPLADTNEAFSRLVAGTGNAIKILVEPGA